MLGQDGRHGLRAALVVHRVARDMSTNMETIKAALDKAASHGADLVLFPEAALTGLTNNDEPSHDLPLGQTIPGPATDTLCDLCSKRGIWLAMGLLERDGDRLYDSAVLIDPHGKIQLKYRRISPGWHGKGADPLVYCQGKELRKVETSLGSFAFLICGDLFDDSIVARLRDVGPDWLLFPFERCFGRDGSDTDARIRWGKEEREQYVDRAKLAGTTTLMANALSDADTQSSNFGGAMVVGADGFVIDSLPLYESGILYVELQR
ncbi:MAG: carbon-nitrogen hydrolase family protein [Dehalococcoidia bacterium]